MKRTGSIGSRVGPAVTSTLQARQLDRPAAQLAADDQAGDDLRRLHHPARARLAAGLAAARRARAAHAARARGATLACVAGWRHMSRFMAGASAIGAPVARHRVVSRLPATPCASCEMKCAVAGATRTRSAQRASSMWPMAASAASSQRSERTGAARHRLERGGVTNRRARRRSSRPALRRRLLQAPDEVGALVGGDAAGDAEQDARSEGSRSWADYGAPAFRPAKGQAAVRRPGLRA